jgi:hypothetical protein
VIRHRERAATRARRRDAYGHCYARCLDLPPFL